MRKIEPAMVAWIDKKLALNGAAQKAIADKDARSLMIYAAESCVGIREIGGNNRGPMVQLIQETVVRAENEAWCMSFVMTMIAYAEVKTGVKSPLKATESCADLRKNTPKSQWVKAVPAPGAIVIWLKSNGLGHTGIMTEWKGKTMLTVEGNTESGLNPKGEVERDGGGTYRVPA